MTSPDPGNPERPVLLAEAVESWSSDPAAAFAALGWDGLNGYQVIQAEPTDPITARRNALALAPDQADNLDRARQAAAWAIQRPAQRGWLFTTHTITRDHDAPPSTLH